MEGTFRYQTSLYATNDISCGNEFVCDTPDAFYYVVFNYGTPNTTLSFTPDFERLGVNSSEFVSCKELWQGNVYNPASMQVSVPSKDVRIYRFERKNYGGVEAVAADPEGSVAASCDGGRVKVTASEPIREASLFNMQGGLVARGVCAAGEKEIALESSLQGAFPAILSVTLESGAIANRKIMMN